VCVQMQSSNAIYCRCALFKPTNNSGSSHISINFERRNVIATGL
jgi:hypothetical protein